MPMPTPSLQVMRYLQGTCHNPVPKDGLRARHKTRLLAIWLVLFEGRRVGVISKYEWEGIQGIQVKCG